MRNPEIVARVALIRRKIFHKQSINFGSVSGDGSGSFDVNLGLNYA